ncbi:DUF58 domain-containing protein [Xylanimonas oleitrophica]|uniref:DUF58 domain-containing protein n=1 Tax=Xylanimonas oleitrophica TaxID=2607479 RepID=A0A2W5WTJ7_9MICO|nr:DUF58 domain-containing protein [Xylanimonas oleitrophica]PZR51566.1 DUF58 domain-containing protein [Xylanimonas oleitrophica]
MRPPRPVRLTGRGAGVALLGALTSGGGLVAAYPGLVALGVGALGLVAVALVSVLVPAPLAVAHRLSPPRTTRLGEAVAHVELHNRSPWLPLTVSGVEQVGGTDRVVGPASLPAGGRSTIEVRLPTERRGLVTVGPFALERRGTADLVVARERRGDPVTLAVTPRVLPVEGPPTGRRRGHVGAQERVEHGGTDLVGLREYVAGDDLRRLHWATSARSGTLMVREDADPAQPHLTVLLDDRAPSHVAEGFEEAVDVVASLVTACARQGVPVRCVTLSGSLDADVPAGVPGAGEPLRAAGGVVDLLTTLPVTAEEVPVALPAGAGAVLDVLAVVTGAGAPVEPLLLAARGAVTTVVLSIDPQPRRVLGAVGKATVVSGPRAEDVLAGWDLVGAR